jgi:DNA-binding transcriptional MerR regulator
MTEAPLYNIGVVTRLTGISIPTLHAWERRYDFPNSARTAGGHRLYSEKDIALLRHVKAQIERGLSTRQAVTAVRQMEADGRLPMAQTDAQPHLAPPAPALPANLGGQLVTALLQHDLEGADRVMADVLGFFPPEEVTLNVIGPALHAIGEAWEQKQISVATEHLSSNYLRHRLLMWMVTGPRTQPVSPIVLACAPEEWHEGSLLMLGVLLRRRGWPVAYLGQNVPFSDLALFIEQIQPSAVVLVAMRAETANLLIDWPKWILQRNGKPAILFGGRAFLQTPDLQRQVAGSYLGDTIQQGADRLGQLLSA